VRRYRVLLPLVVHTEDGSYEQGEEFEKEFADWEEAANLASGLLELMPQEYEVIGGSNVHGAEPGETFSAAIPLGNEAQLIEGGHIKLVEPKPEKPKRKAKADKSA
jgi:hypothetical protein